MSEYFIYGYLVGVAAGIFCGVLIQKHNTKDYIYKSKDIKDAYRQGHEDGREDRQYQINYNHQSDLSH